MTARQRKKWKWHECCHIELRSDANGFPTTKCKQNKRFGNFVECLQCDCKKYFVSNFRKHCNHLGWKAAIRYSRNNELYIP